MMSLMRDRLEQNCPKVINGVAYFLAHPAYPFSQILFDAEF